MKSVQDWATSQINNDVATSLKTTTKTHIAIHADKFAEPLDSDTALGPLCIKAGVYACRVGEGRQHGDLTLLQRQSTLQACLLQSTDLQ